VSDQDLGFQRKQHGRERDRHDHGRKHLIKR
jgi:hypothetical protein